MYIFRKLIGYAKLDPSEEKNFMLLFLQTLLFGFGTSFYLVVVSSYFIKKASISSLPTGYILSGIFGFLLTAFYKRVAKKRGAIPSYSAVLLSFGIVSVLLFACRQHFPDSSPVSKYVAYLGFIGLSPYIAIIALGYSTITLKVFNLAQSKRLLALIGTGEVVASFIAYLSVPLFKQLLGSEVPLLLFSAGSSFIAILSLKYISRHNKEKLQHIPAARLERKIDLKLFFKNEFYLLFAVVSIFSVLAVYFVDFSFLLSVRYVASESGIETATVVSVVFCVIKFGEVVFSLLSRSIMSSQGMKVALLAQPAVLLGSTVLAAVFGVTFWNIPFLVVAFLLFNKWAIRVIGKALSTPAMKVLYMVTDEQDRASLQASIDGTLNQYATLLSGGLLLIISTCFGHMEIILFLKLVAIICILAFGAWVSFTLKLFTNYKIKIKDYLHHLLEHEKNSGLVNEEAGISASEQTAVVNHPFLEKALSETAVLDRDTLNQYISSYNPEIKKLIRNDPFSYSVLKRAYYNNENFFSRLLIIWYNRAEPLHFLSFVKEFYRISDLQLKIQMIKLLNESGYVPDAANSYYFTSQCEECVKEIIWTEATINDVLGSVDQKLTDALFEHTKIQQQLLFELLKVLYEKDSITAIQDVVNGKDKSFEKKIFAVELLDNILDTGMKKLVIPLFEDISFNTRKEKLQKILLIYNLSVTDRLKEILMTNFMTVGPYIKQLALEEYYRLTQDKSILSASLSSNLENLSATAAILLNNAEEPLFTDKMQTIEEINLPHFLSGSLIPYYLKWGLFARQKNNRANKNATKQTFQSNADHIESITYPNGILSVDVLGLSLMLRMK